ncbi:uncharacterized protein [Centruroides vittatus]|uniref:uncharacterized protein n=1 Tax=Centruroides vittatus TaxID=120091 RepID=UPI00350F3148
MKIILEILIVSAIFQVIIGLDQDEINEIEDVIPGKAGEDYPLNIDFPKTEFRCSNYNYSGFFADPELGCQGYHICFPDGRNASFLCVNGTVFNQRYFVCDWWFHFDCSVAPLLYPLNLVNRPPLPNLPRIIKKFLRPRKRVTTPKPRPLAVRQASDCYCPCLNETSTLD